MELSALIFETVSAANIRNHLKILRDRRLLKLMASGLASVHNHCFDSTADGSVLLDELRALSARFREYDDGRGGLIDELRAWVDVTSGDFSVTECYRDLHLVTKSDKANCRKAIQRLEEENIVRKTGSRRGHYRRIEGECEPIDYMSAREESLEVRWPFEIEELAEFMPGNIAVVAGSQTPERQPSF